MKKKFLSLVLVLLFSVFFVGCGGDYLNDYTITKDIEVTEIEASEIDKNQEAIAEAMKEVKVVTFAGRMRMDTGEIDVFGKKSRTVMNMDIEYVVDMNDPKNIKFQILMEGNGEITVDGEGAGSSKVIMNEYLKDGYLYSYSYEKNTLLVDGKEETKENEEKIKTKYTDDSLELPEGMPDMPESSEEFIKDIKELFSEMKSQKGAEIGQDKKGNLVLQAVSEKDGKRVCLTRVVFSNGLPVYFGANIGGYLNLGETIVEMGIKCNSGKVKYPNFDDYKEIK